MDVFATPIGVPETIPDYPVAVERGRSANTVEGLNETFSLMEEERRIGGR